MKIKLDEGAIMPTKGYRTDAGYDLYSRDDITIKAHNSAKFDTGVHVKIPRGYCGMLKSKSGLNVNHGITSEGVIDYGYTGSIVAKLHNHSDEDYHVSKGDKITQLVITQILTPSLEIVDEIIYDDADRGDRGFGSSGKQRGITYA